MKDYPEKIEKMQSEVAAMNRTIQNEREKIDVFEADLTIEIHTAKGEDGKPLFSNEAMRKAAFIKRCADSPDYVILSEGLQKLEYDRLLYLAAIERYRLEYKLFLLDREEEIKIKN